MNEDGRLVGSLLSFALVGTSPTVSLISFSSALRQEEQNPRLTTLVVGFVSFAMILGSMFKIISKFFTSSALTAKRSFFEEKP